MTEQPASIGTRTYELNSEGHSLATFDVDVHLDPTQEVRTHAGVTISLDIDRHMRDIAHALREVADELEADHT